MTKVREPHGCHERETFPQRHLLGVEMAVVATFELCVSLFNWLARLNDVTI
jgi:hypothetical protein